MPAERKRFRTTLYNPLAYGRTEAGKPVQPAYAGEASTMTRAYKRAIAGAAPSFFTAGRDDWQAVADDAFKTARIAMTRHARDTIVSVNLLGFTVAVERLT